MGTWDYKFLDSIPAAENSLLRMVEVLTGPLCGWPQDRLLVVGNERSPGDLPDRLITAFDGISDIALFYYVGHGQIAPDDQLCLGLRQSRPEPNRRAATSLRFSDVRQALQDSDAAVRIVILDCCFAGLATIGTMSGQAGEVLDLTAGTGAYTMAATGSYSTAWYEVGSRLTRPQTYFTKYLVDLIEQGIPDEPSRLRLDVLFRELRENLATDHRPIPSRRAVDDARDFQFAYNAAPARISRAPERQCGQPAQAAPPAPVASPVERPPGDAPPALARYGGPVTGQTLEFPRPAAPQPPPPRWPVPVRPTPRRLAWRPAAMIGAATVALVVVLLLVLVPQGKGGQPDGAASSQNHTPSRQSAVSSAPPGPGVLKPVDARSFNPYGFPSGDTENGIDAPEAVDGSTATAWTTLRYFNHPEFGSLKPGAGLLLDMGKPVTLSSVTVTLGKTPGADVRIEVGNSAVISASNLNAFVTVASKRGIGGTSVFTTNVKAAGRYVLIWFTKLPPDGKKSSGMPEYQAAVYNVALWGSS